MNRTQDNKTPSRGKTSTTACLTMTWIGATIDYECSRETLIEPNLTGAQYVEHSYQVERKNSHGVDYVMFDEIDEMKELASVLLDFAAAMERRETAERKQMEAAGDDGDDTDDNNE